MRIHANKTTTMFGQEYYEPVADKDLPYTHWILDEKAFKELWGYKKDLDTALTQIAEEQSENSSLIEKYNVLVKKYRELQDAVDDIEEIEQIRQETEAVRQTKKHIIELCRERANKERKIKNKKDHPGYVILDSRLINYRCKGKDTTEMWKTTVQTPFFVELDKEEFYEYFVYDEYRMEFFDKIGIGSFLDLGEKKTKTNIVDHTGKYFIEQLLHKNFKSGFWEVDLIHYCEVRL